MPSSLRISLKHVHLYMLIIGAIFRVYYCKTENVNINPNIVFILADDLGYGDIKSFNRYYGNISTPNIDSIGKNGISFLDAHSSSSVCTPSRYSILTGNNFVLKSNAPTE